MQTRLALCGVAYASPGLRRHRRGGWRLGPVQVNEPVLGNIGPNALITFYAIEDGKCAVQVLTWQRADTEAIGASRSRLTLNPEQQMNIDSIQDSLTLKCGKDASNIRLIPPVLSAGFGTAK